MKAMAEKYVTHVMVLPQKMDHVMMEPAEGGQGAVWRTNFEGGKKTRAKTRAKNVNTRKKRLKLNITPS